MRDCLFDIAYLSTLVSILLSCVWFAHPLTWEQFIGAAVVFGSLYAKTLMRKEPPKATITEDEEKASKCEVKQDSQRWRKRAILLNYLVQICLKP
ncbi:unnamed protein product [Rhodiola kirilowii]